MKNKYTIEKQTGSDLYALLDPEGARVFFNRDKETAQAAADAANQRLVARAAQERLFDAAPDLLSALQESVNQIDTTLAESRFYGFSNERINMLSAASLIARKAIAKAKGQ